MMEGSFFFCVGSGKFAQPQLAPGSTSLGGTTERHLTPSSTESLGIQHPDPVALLICPRGVISRGGWLRFTNNHESPGCVVWDS